MRTLAGPKAVLAYLSHYTHRVAISNSRLIAADAERVTFKVENDGWKGTSGSLKLALTKPGRGGAGCPAAIPNAGRIDAYPCLSNATALPGAIQHANWVMNKRLKSRSKRRPMFQSKQARGLGLAPRPDNPHTANFPDPNANRPGALRVWINVGGGVVISVDSPREGRLVLKTILALAGSLDARVSGLQQCSDDGSWQEWTDASGRRIHELDDENLLFLPPSQEPRHRH